MGFTGAQATDGRHPVPTTPGLAQASWGRFRALTATAVLARAALFAGAMLGPFALVLAGGLRFETLGGSEARWVGLGLSVTCLIMAAALDFEVKAPLVRWAGSGTTGNTSVSGFFSRPPQPLHEVSRAATWLAATLAAPVALALTPLLADPSGPQLAACVVVALGITLGCGRRAIQEWRTSRAGIAEVEQERETVAAVRAAGRRTTATVERVVLPGTWIDDMVLARIEVRVDVPGAPLVALRVIEHPIWAPAVGNVLDVWVDPAAPEDPRRMVFERRLVGQTRPVDPETLRRPAEGGDGPGIGPAEPAWARPLSAGMRAQHLLGALAALVALLATTVGSNLRLTGHGTQPWWLWLILGGLVLSTLVVACWWLAPWVAPRYILTSGGGAGGAAICCSVLALVAIFEIAWRWAAVPAEGLSEVVAALSPALGLFLLAAVVAPLFSLTCQPGAVAVAYATNPRTDPAIVIEALRSGDPGSLARLQAEHGYTAGLRHVEDVS